MILLRYAADLLSELITKECHSKAGRMVASLDPTMPVIADADTGWVIYSNIFVVP